jgi:hypothetical protein
MSEIRINILDKDRGVCGEVHGSTGDAIVAALSAEPETIDELSLAFRRYRAPDDDHSPFDHFSPSTNFKSHDAGIVVIDLAGRTIGYESTYSYPGREGAIRLRTGNSDEYLPIRFRLPEDWMFVKSIPLFEGTAARRREERLANPPADSRAVLYGKPMIEFIIGEIGANLDSTDEDLFISIHAKWFMTPRDDLQGKTPREVMFEKRKFIDFDLFSRETQWSFTGICPPPLLEKFAAYKFAGFGTHEIVTYYYLFRHLLEKGWDRRKGGFDLRSEDLETAMAEWMKTPEDFNRTPHDIINCERKRIPLVMKGGEDIFDEDCPTCVSMSEILDTPGFWHLDGCNMDDRFEFSFCETREEWEAEQREYEEYSSNYSKGNYRKLDLDTLPGDDDKLVQ